MENVYQNFLRDNFSGFFRNFENKNKICEANAQKVCRLLRYAFTLIVALQRIAILPSEAPMRRPSDSRRSVEGVESSISEYLFLHDSNPGLRNDRVGPGKLGRKRTSFP